MIQLLHYRKLPLPVFFIALLFMGGTAMAQKTWAGGVGPAAWDVAANWAPTGVPLATETVTINSNAEITIPAAGVACASLTVTNNASAIIRPTAGTTTLTLQGTGTVLNVTSGSTLTVRGRNGGGVNNMSLLFATGAGKTATIAGNLIVALAPASANDIGIFNSANSATTVTGSIRQNGGTLTTTAATLTIGGTGIYLHGIDGGSIVTATWNTGSTVEVTGVTGALPGNLNAAYTNLIWNCTAQTGDLAFEAALPTEIPGNFTVASTGTGGGAGTLRLANGTTNRFLTVNGNFVHSGGEFRVDNGNGGSELTVIGNATFSGTQNFIIASGTGNAILDVNGNVSITGGTFEMSDDAAVGNLQVAGDFSHTAGTITETAGGSGLITFDGAVQLFTSGGTVSNDIDWEVLAGSTLQMAAATTVVGTAAAGTTFTLNTDATLGIRSVDGIANAAATTGHIRTTTRNYATGANYLYNGTVAQNTGNGIPTGLTGRLVINNTAGVTLNNAESIGGGGTVELLGGTFAAGTNLTLNSTCNIIRNAGAITGTFAGAGSYNVTYNGNPGTTGPELQGGQGASNRITNLTIDLATSSTSLTMSSVAGSETRIQGLLTLTDGILVSSASNTLEMAGTATTTGGDATSYVAGPMRKVGTAAFFFPIGAAGQFRPAGVSGSATVTTTAMTTASEITAEFIPAIPARVITPFVLQSPLVSLTPCGYWNIDRNVGPTSNVFIWLSTGPADLTQNIDFIRSCLVGTYPPINVAGLRVSRHNAAQWLDLGAGTAAQTANAWFISANLPSTVFSPFAIASALDALPVTFTSFTAQKDGDAVRLGWETSSEQNSAYFDVERSSDGINFSSIGRVNAAGNSASLRRYSFTDNNPATGRNFYRLRQVDLDAQFAYSKTISVNMAPNAAVSIYPNPVQSNVMVEYPKMGKGATYKVVGVDGRVMQSGVLQENSSQQNLNLSNLQRGNYILVIQGDGQQYVQKIVKQ